MSESGSEPAAAVACPRCGGAHPPDVLVCPKTRESLPLAGRILDGKFHVVGKIGEGGMSTVWRAEHIRVAKLVAIKVMHPEYARNPRTLARFRKEATSAGRIGNAHICDILDFGESELGPYIVMELLRGQSFGGLLEKNPKIDPGFAVAIIRQALAGLSAAHRVGIIHRDLKPDNIFLHEPEPGRLLVKLTDFGISKFTEETGEGRTGANVLMGTPEYMSPEQAEGAANVDVRTDVWAMGVILYRAITGTDPFAGPTLAATLLALTQKDPPPIESLSPGLAPGLAAVIKRCLIKDPAQRWPSADALAEALGPYDALAPTVFAAPPPMPGAAAVGTVAPSTMAPAVLATSAPVLTPPDRSAAFAPTMTAPPIAGMAEPFAAAPGLPTPSEGQVGSVPDAPPPGPAAAPAPSAPAPSAPAPSAPAPSAMTRPPLQVAEPMSLGQFDVPSRGGPPTWGDGPSALGSGPASLYSDGGFDALPDRGGPTGSSTRGGSASSWGDDRGPGAGASWTLGHVEGEERPRSLQRSRTGWIIGVTTVLTLALVGVGITMMVRPSSTGDAATTSENDDANGDGRVAVADEAGGGTGEGDGGTAGAQTGGDATGGTTPTGTSTGGESTAGGGTAGGGTTGGATTGGGTGDATTAGGDTAGGDTAGGGTTGGGTTGGGTTGGGTTGGGSTDGGGTTGGGGGGGGGKKPTPVKVDEDLVNKSGSLYAPKSDPPRRDYAGAQSYCNSLLKKRYAGLRRWRLPKVSELKTFRTFDYAKSLYWSSERDGGTATGVNLFDGGEKSVELSSSARVLCVSPK